MAVRHAKVKHFRPPKPKGDWPEPPLIDDEPAVHAEPVVHPVYGAGRYAWADWVDDDGNWVDPTLRGAQSRRDTTRGRWQAVVTTERGGYRCPISELSRT